MSEYDSAGTLLRRYVHGPGIDQPLVGYEGTTTTHKTWLYSDHQGSLVASANSAGTSTALYRYGPYGELNQTTGIRFRYTGQQLIGSLNLYYYKARFYSPALGRFLQTDPIGYRDGLNLYAYVGNNPINWADPSGLLAADMKLLTGNLSNQFGATASAFGDAVAARPALQTFLGGSTLGGGLGLATAYPVATAVGLSSLELGSLASGDMPVGGVGLASNIANGPRLSNQLTLESANSPFTAAGTLTREAVNSATAIKNLGPGQLSNPAIPAGFGKYTTETFQSPAGNFQTHFYMNPSTSEVFYGLDYKVIFNSMSGVR